MRIIGVIPPTLPTLILFPVFIFIRTKRYLPSFALLWKFFFLSIIGITLMQQNCVFTGVNYSSPTLALAMSNLVPAFTFLLAVIFRMEKLDLRSSRNQIKIIAVFVSISGALVVTLYKGPSIGSFLEQSSSSRPLYQVLETQTNWVLGGLFLASASLCLTLWNTFQCAVVALIAERNHPKAWILRHNVELVSVIYSAVFGNVVTFCAETLCIYKKGPVFVAMFKPLGISIAALMGVIFLSNTIHVGS